MTNITKAELLKENAELKAKLQLESSNEHEYRKNMSKVLNAPTKRNNFGSDGEMEIYSWQQIFFEVGKLSAKNNNNDLAKKVETQGKTMMEMDMKLDDLQMRIDSRTSGQAGQGHALRMR